MYETDRAIRSVAVLGGGIVGLSAALAFARAMPQLVVTVVDVPNDPAALADRMPGTLPAIHRFHAAIGLDEEMLTGAGIATRRIAVRFDNWSRTGRPWYQFTGETGAKAGSVDFHHLWARAHRAGEAEPWHRYATAGRLAEAGRSALSGNTSHALPADYDYALRLDPARYRETLASMAVARGITLVPATLGEVKRRADGGVAALSLTSGQHLEADLFLDCAGPGASLSSAIGPEAEEREDWSAFTPCDRLAFTAAPAEESGPCDTVTALEDGWTMRVPLGDRTLIYDGWSSRVAGRFRETAVTLRPGRRAVPWRYNVLALGDAAISIDPVGSLNLHLAHRAILRALELLPGRDCHPIELAEYNRRSDQEAHATLDLLGLLNLTGPFRPSRTPDSLLHMLDQFERRGRIVLDEESPLIAQEWLAVLIGMGVHPLHNTPLAASVSDGRALAILAASKGDDGVEAASFAEPPADDPLSDRWANKSLSPQFHKNRTGR